MPRNDVTSSTDQRATAITELLAAAPDATDYDAVRHYLRSLAAAGLHVLFVYPGSKQPCDMRTSHKRRRDDERARAAAQAAGQPGWSVARSPAGLALATDDTALLDTYLDRYIKQFPTSAVNLAVVAGPSRLVVVDCDTPEQVAAWYADNGADTAPTVTTPGQADASGGMVHHGGGHWWFTVPDDAPVPGVNSISLGDGDARYTVMAGASYVLVPPSVRREGDYKTTGDAQALPGWLAARIADAGAARAQRAARRREHTTGGGIDRWGAETAWDLVLAGTGWQRTSKADSCHCPVWTAPGAHASLKSATGHEPGCDVWDSANPPLHIWTDGEITPFEDYRGNDSGNGTTVSKFQAFAAIHHNGDLAAALADLDLGPDLALDDDDIGQLARNADGHTAAAAATGNGDGSRKRRLLITWAEEIEPEPVNWLWVDITAHNTGQAASDPGTPVDPHDVEDIACVAPGHTWSPPDVEFNGRIPCGMVTIAAGREGTGKSSFGIWATAKITRGTLPGHHYGTPRRVFYVATEDSWQHTLVPRLIAAGADRSMVGRIEVVTAESTTVTVSLPGDTEMLTEAVIDNDVALVVIDPLMSTIEAGINTNDSREVRSALEPIVSMADRTGAAVLGIAHFNKASGVDSASRITGSGAFKDIVRAVLAFGRDGDGDNVFSQSKNSVGSLALPSLKYEIHPEVVPTEKGKASAGVFAFTALADASVDDALEREHRSKGRGHDKEKSDVERFIVDYITEHADNDGEVEAAAVIKAGGEVNFSEDQIKHARRRATGPVIDSRREGFGPGSHLLWKLVGSR
jgi:hypothetical protein